MVITKDFVFIHMNKTGGTFVTEMLRKVYLGYRYRSKEGVTIRDKCLHLRDRFLRKLSLSPWLDTNKHGSCNDIPIRYKSLPILGCIRNPFDWYVSLYEFQWWKRHPEEYPGLLENPHFPNLSFKEFLQLENNDRLNSSNPGVAVDPTIGRLTTLFINFYFRRPNEVLQSVAGLESKERLARAMYPVTFLHTETLNRDLSEYLSQFISSRRLLRFVELEKPILPPGGTRRETQWRDHYNADLMAEIRERDRLVFSLFPAYDTEP
jgi:Sulfotransferase family